ncbi:MAG: phage tail sheath C-terminal domain-containing protein [Endozoicomonas sp. (ex Botrylloides leachii)]|nr:phage tail sheath C-terminal domain-containing protein [Endozoicomonas sp. (ex Botrylloides leachii)]
MIKISCFFEKSVLCNSPLNAETVQPASARVAGMIARSDNDRGFWWSPSNTEMLGIIGTARPIDFTLGDVNSRANLLNEGNVTTIIRESGFRLWGNRTLGADPKWAFLNVRRTADIIQDSIQRAHLWAVDRNITKTYVENVTDGVNAYLRELKTLGAIAGGECWADKELNTKEVIQAGKVYFDFDFSPYSPAERLTFRSHLTNDYLEEIIG